MRLEDYATFMVGDAVSVLKGLPDKYFNTVVTSPPYFGLRDYGVDGQMGLEPTVDEYVDGMVGVFREVRRVLRDDGTLWLNLGDSFSRSQTTNVPQTKNKPLGYPTHSKIGSSDKAVGRGSRPGSRASNLSPKQLLGIPWRVAFALQDDGWYLRQDIIWHKPNPMPESVTDRCTKAHEYVFMLTKKSKYFYDARAISEPATYSGLVGQDESGFKNAANFDGNIAGGNSNRGEKPDKQRGHSMRHAGFNDRYDAMSKSEQGSGRRNKRSVWPIATRPFHEAHFATMAPELADTCIKAGCPTGGTVLDPFGGAGTTAVAAVMNGTFPTLIEINPEYMNIAKARVSGLLGGEITKRELIGAKASVEFPDFFEEK